MVTSMYIVTLSIFFHQLADVYSQNDITLSAGHLGIVDTEEVKNPRHVEELGTVELWCNATGDPAPTVKWYTVGSEGQRTDIGIKGKLLQIHNVTRECSQDLYECVASNGENTVNRTYRVIPEYKPFVDIYVESSNEELLNISQQNHNSEDEYILYQKMMDTVTFLCTVDTSPIGNTTWYYNNTWIFQCGNTSGKPNTNRNTKHHIPSILSAYNPPSCDVSINKRTIEMKLRFKISDGFEFGKHSCCSSNQYGKDCWNISLVEQYSKPSR